MLVATSDAIEIPVSCSMDSDYGYSSEEDSYEAMGSEGDSFDFDSQAEMETHAKKV